MKIFKKGVAEHNFVEPSTHSEEVDIDSVMKKYDRDSNIRVYNGIPRSIIRYLLTLFALYSIYINFFANWETRIERASFVGIAMFMIFLLFPAKRGLDTAPNYIPWYDLGLAALSGFSYFYFVLKYRQLTGCIGKLLLSCSFLQQASYGGAGSFGNKMFTQVHGFQHFFGIHGSSPPLFLDFSGVIQFFDCIQRFVH